MKAAALVEPGRIEVLDLPEPECGPGEVLVRVLGVGLCGTDIGVYLGNRSTPQMPWVLGHEGAGEIVAVGDGVRDRVVGQRIAIEPNYCCLRCPPCLRGLTSSCVNRVSVGPTVPGVLAEYVVVPAAFAHPVAAHVELPDLVCAEPLTVARAAIRRSGLRAGEGCLVVGAGSQGQFVCISVAEAGTTPLVSEPHDGRRELALTLGALPADGSAEKVDHVFETSGAAAALAPALDRLAPGGHLTLIGISPSQFAVTTKDLVYRQLTLSGSLIYDHPRDFADTIAVLEKGALEPHRVLGAEFALDDTAAAFDAVATTPGKCWINLSE